MRFFSFSLLLFVFISCAGHKSTIRKYQDVQAMTSQVLNYREKIRDNGNDLIALKGALEPTLTFSLRKDFELYDELSSALTAMDETHNFILGKVQIQRKTVSMIRKDSKVSLDTEIPDTETTYGDNFSKLDSLINDAFNKLNRDRERLIKALKKKNKNLIFISNQLLKWKPTILKLQEKRKNFQPRIDKLTESIAIEITFDKAGESVELISQKTAKVDEVTQRMIKIDRYFSAMESIAKKEAGGNVYLIGIGSKKMKYERRYHQFVEEYRDHLKSLNILLPD
ncbi:MAG: hypothetical protein HON83_07675 [Candidatus Marinimicrobia bacterium]|jgi:hypothetical protein|nr:hypothetical protein [Candidatus Neomarinimicrobiota bacterium]MBT6368184.1 hypothetical protein [Candidatus Neomarinimicrobiota bacterium]MBT7111607.1 hypothetical protein [Candidatus Neomarinimicrobiota bacterium]